MAAAFAQENLVKNPSFEQPEVRGATSARNGGSPAKLPEEETSWSHFQSLSKPDDKTGGQIVVGLTNGFARTGKQSVFVDFQQVVTPLSRSFLMSNIIPVKAGQSYRVSLWGRIDRQRPISLDQRRPVMRTEIEYFTPDSENQAGETDYRTQMIPGSVDRLFFTSSKWTEYFAVVRAPEDAGFMKVTFRWETDKDAGITDGAIYFDDAGVVAVPGGESLAPLDPLAPKPPAPASESDEAAPDAAKE